MFNHLCTMKNSGLYLTISILLWSSAVLFASNACAFITNSGRTIRRTNTYVQPSLNIGSACIISSTKSFSKSENAFTEEEILSIAKGYVSEPSPDKWSKDFIFRGPVIGPLTKDDLIKTLSSVNSNEKMGIDDAFPDMEGNNFGFSVDPTEPDRVWYFVRPRGTFTGPFNHPVAGIIEPTGAKYIAPPEARSVIIDQDGKIKYQSVGYVVDRFTGDTTGGTGAVFGMYAVMGQPLDDTVGSKSLVFLQWLTSVLPEGMFPRSFSKKENIPSWWKDERMGAEK